MILTIWRDACFFLCTAFGSRSTRLLLTCTVAVPRAFFLGKRSPRLRIQTPLAVSVIDRRLFQRSPSGSSCDDGYGWTATVRVIKRTTKGQSMESAKCVFSRCWGLRSDDNCILSRRRPANVYAAHNIVGRCLRGVYGSVQWRMKGEGGGAGGRGRRGPAQEAALWGGSIF